MSWTSLQWCRLLVIKKLSVPPTGVSCELKFPNMSSALFYSLLNFKISLKIIIKCAYAHWLRDYHVMTYSFQIITNRKKAKLRYSTSDPHTPEPEFVNPGIDSKESISPAYVAWRAGTIMGTIYSTAIQCLNFWTTYGGQEPSRNRVLVPARQAT